MLWDLYTYWYYRMHISRQQSISTPQPAYFTPQRSPRHPFWYNHYCTPSHCLVLICRHFDYLPPVPATQFTSITLHSPFRFYTFAVTTYGLVIISRALLIMAFDAYFQRPFSPTAGLTQFAGIAATWSPPYSPLPLPISLLPRPDFAGFWLRCISIRASPQPQWYW